MALSASFVVPVLGAALVACFLLRNQIDTSMMAALVQRSERGLRPKPYEDVDLGLATTPVRGPRSRNTGRRALSAAHDAAARIRRVRASGWRTLERNLRKGAPDLPLAHFVSHHRIRRVLIEHRAGVQEERGRNACDL